MNKSVQLALASAAVFAAAGVCAIALKKKCNSIKPASTTAHHGDPAKKAILVVSFGTSYAESREKTIGAIENDFRNAFPDFDVRRAFTSNMIINKLKKRDGIYIDTVGEALKRLYDEGYGTVICQPTHVMNGEEYDGVAAEVSRWKHHFAHLICGCPLLTSPEDYCALAKALRAEFSSLDNDTALVLMGHGTEHPANASYPAFSHYLKAQGCDRFFVGTVEGDPELSDVLNDVKASGVKKVVLTPLMVVAGDHANNDMCSNDDSWQNQFIQAGFETSCIIKGLGEYPSVRMLYLKHCFDCIEKLQEEQICKD